MYNEIEGRSEISQATPRTRTPDPIWEGHNERGEGKTWKTWAIVGASAMALGLSTIALAVAAGGNGADAATTRNAVQKHHDKHKEAIHQRYVAPKGHHHEHKRHEHKHQNHGHQMGRPVHQAQPKPVEHHRADYARPQNHSHHNVQHTGIYRQGGLAWEMTMPKQQESIKPQAQKMNAIFAALLDEPTPAPKTDTALGQNDQVKEKNACECPR